MSLCTLNRLLSAESLFQLLSTWPVSLGKSPSSRIIQITAAHWAPNILAYYFFATCFKEQNGSFSFSPLYWILHFKGAGVARCSWECLTYLGYRNPAMWLDFMSEIALIRLEKLPSESVSGGIGIEKPIRWGKCCKLPFKPKKKVGRKGKKQQRAVNKGCY